MLSKNKLKYIRSLERKKGRNEENAFVAEGPKTVGDLGEHLRCKLLVATREWLNRWPAWQAEEVVEVTGDELARASFLKTPQEVLAVFERPADEGPKAGPDRTLCLALDEVQDPGNLGTIVRLADWFGIDDIFCSPGTADVFSPKAVQATMGALARVRLHYGPLADVVAAAGDAPVYGTFLDGENLYEQPLSATGLLVMGNEGNGISAEVERMVTQKLYIPNFPPERATSESLNVAIATAVVCAEFRRRRL